MNDFAIDIDKLSVSFHDNGKVVHAISEIDLEVRVGEFLCVLGESGCGKSTLLRVLAGLQKSTSGMAKCMGKPIVGPDPSIGVVFQSPALLPWLSVRKNVELGYRIREEAIPHDDVSELIDLMGLSEFEHAKPDSLSGGMAQRTAIARSLVHRPPILLMDEPFSALDAMTRLRLQVELIRIWQQHKITIVFITHDIDEAISLGTRIVVMTPRPGRLRRIMQVTMPYPRSSRSPDFMRLKAEISDELFDLIGNLT